MFPMSDAVLFYTLLFFQEVLHISLIVSQKSKQNLVSKQQFPEVSI